MDIVVLGGGIVGLTLANLLAQNAALNIALIEPNTPQLHWDLATYDLRCSAITPAAQKIFSSLGIWREITLHRAGMCKKMLVWDQELHNKIEFDAQAMNLANLGYIVENRVIIKALYAKLALQKNVRILHATADDLQQDAQQNIVTVGSTQIVCKLVIGADGSNSWLRNKVNIASYGWDYQHAALVANIATQHAHANVAMQRFMPHGVLAFLPLSATNLCAIVWSSTPDNIQRLQQLAAEEFCLELAKEFSHQLGALKLVSARATFALRMLHATNYVLPRIALVGDAAHVIHPLAGQGLNLGIADAAALNNVLQHAYSTHQDLGALKILRKYERERKAHNLSMIALMEGFKRGFATQNPIITRIRAQGLHLLDNLSFAKKAITRFACQQN